MYLTPLEASVHVKEGVRPSCTNKDIDFKAWLLWEQLAKRTWPICMSFVQQTISRPSAHSLVWGPTLVYSVTESSLIRRNNSHRCCRVILTFVSRCEKSQLQSAMLANKKIILTLMNSQAFEKHQFLGTIPTHSTIVCVIFVGDVT